MGSCGNCKGNCSGCSGCGGCGGALELTKGEIDMLLELAQIPFLPVARKLGEDIPVFLEKSDRSAEEYSLILQCLEKRRLISIDYDQPLKGPVYDAYANYPIQGSFALTQRGQNVLELLDLQGLE